MKQETKSEVATGPVCTYCHQGVIYPDFECGSQPGNHQLPAKTYYHPGGSHIQDRRDRRRYHLTLILKPARESHSESGGMEVRSPQVVAEVHDGKFTTTDAELQWYCDREPEMKSGAEGEQMWKRIYLTDAQQMEAAKQELAALEASVRKLRESSSLLDSVKASTK